jgi:hypothetical protein
LLALMVGTSMWWRSLRYPLESSVVRALPESEADGSAPVCRLAHRMARCGLVHHVQLHWL